MGGESDHVWRIELEINKENQSVHRHRARRATRNSNDDVIKSSANDRGPGHSLPRRSAERSFSVIGARSTTPP
jgi:hypothetical protein